LARIDYATPPGALSGGIPALNLDRMISHNPALKQSYLGVGAHLIGHGLLEEKLREIVILAVGRLSGSAYEIHQHRSFARAVGLSDAKIAAVIEGESEPLSAEERLAVRFTEELYRDGNVSDATFAEAQSFFPPAQLMELVILIGFYRTTATLLKVFAVDLDEAVFGDRIVAMSRD
jgi:4-carboxymuconolactone decarboxylase